MSPATPAVPRFAFSRRDPSAILERVDRRLRAGDGNRVLALGGQARDRVYCAQLLAAETGQTFVQIDLAIAGRGLEDEKALLEKALGLARAAPTTLLLDGAETLFAVGVDAKTPRTAQLGAYLKRALAVYPGTVVLGMPEKVEPDPARLPPIDLEVTFRAPSGNVIVGRPVPLPSQAITGELLPGHNFQVDIDGVDVGMCAVSAPLLVGGPYSGEGFDSAAGPAGFESLTAEQQAAWPTLTLRRALTQSRLFFDWKQAQSAGKPLLRELTLRQLDWPGRRVVNTWNIAGCWARSWRGPAFDAVRGTVAEEELVLYYSGLSWR